MVCAAVRAQRSPRRVGDTTHTAREPSPTGPRRHDLGPLCRATAESGPVPAGVHHDVTQPLPVTVTLRWVTGADELATIALRWTRTLVRVPITEVSRDLCRGSACQPQ